MIHNDGKWWCFGINMLVRFRCLYFVPLWDNALYNIVSKKVWKNLWWHALVYLGEWRNGGKMSPRDFDNFFLVKLSKRSGYGRMDEENGKLAKDQSCGWNDKFAKECGKGDGLVCDHLDRGMVCQLK